MPARRTTSAFMYTNGQGVAQDDAEAVAGIRKAAEQGNAGAQFYAGLDVRKPAREWRRTTRRPDWYRKAAEQGNALAQNNLGDHVRERPRRGAGLCAGL